jgi:hypothetical protein
LLVEFYIDIVSLPISRSKHINQKRDIAVIPNINKAKETLMCLERDIGRETISM